jgi:hypothetical protein
VRALLIAAVGAVAAGAVGAGAGCHGDWRQAGSHDNHPLVPALPPAYDAALPAWPPAVPTARIGRGVAPTRAVPVAITAAAGEAPRQPLVVTAVHAVPVGPEAPAVAIASGVIGDAPVIEAIGVDDGVVRWRDQTRCMAPVVHVTSSVVVCAGATGVAALDVETGVERWRLEELTYVGAQGDLVLAVLPPARAVVVRADDGEALAAADVPPTVVPGELRVACAQGAGFEVWAWSSAQLQRFAIGGGAEGRRVDVAAARAGAGRAVRGARAGRAADPRQRRARAVRAAPRAARVRRRRGDRARVLAARPRRGRRRDRARDRGPRRDAG